MRPTKSAPAFQTFYDYVFGDSQYFYYNGLPEDVCTGLQGLEQNRAEELVLIALKQRKEDERPIRAAGYLKLQAAIPLLENRLSTKGNRIRQNINDAIVWALLKIKGAEAYLDDIQSTVKNAPNRIVGLTRADAIDLLSVFGNKPFVIETLFDAFLDDDISVRVAALSALRKIYRFDSSITNLLVNRTITASREDRSEIIKQIKEVLGT